MIHVTTSDKLLQEEGDERPVQTSELCSPTSAAGFADVLVLKEVVRLSVREAMQEIKEELLDNLHTLSEALEAVCGSARDFGKPGATSESFTSSMSAEREQASQSGYSGGSQEILPSLSGAQAMAVSSRMPSIPNHEGDRQVWGQVPASSSSLSPGGSVIPRTQSPIRSFGPGESKLDSQPPGMTPDERQSSQESSRHASSAGGEERVPSTMCIEKHMGDEQQAEEFAHKEPEAGKGRPSQSEANEKAEDDEKVRLPHSLSRADRLPGAVVDQEVQHCAPTKNHGASFARPSQSLPSQAFAKRRAKHGHRMPRSLSDMEDESMILDMEDLYQRKGKKRNKRRKNSSSPSSLSRVAPGTSKDVEGTANMTNLQDARCVERQAPGDCTPGVKYDIGSDDCEKGPESQGLGTTSVMPDGTRTKAPRSLERLCSDHAQNILDDYAGLEDSISPPASKWKARVEAWNHTFFSSRLVLALKEVPEYCLLAFGITQQGSGVVSRSYAMAMGFIRLGVVSFIVVQHCAVAMEFPLMFYSSFTHVILALGAFLSRSLIWEGSSKALLGGHFDAIQMFASENHFLSAWRTKSFRYFCLVVFSAAGQLVLMFIPAPGGIAQECMDGGLGKKSPAMLAAHIFVVGLMAMLSFLHLRMCAGLQLMVDSFCEDFKMGKDELRATSQWNIIYGLINKTTSTIGTSFLAQISTYAAALVLAAADVLDGNMKLDSVCALPWPLNWLGPTMLGFSMLFLALIESGRFTSKCSRVAGFVSTVRYREGSLKTTSRNLQQYLVDFIHRTSSGFLIHGVQVTTFVAFKLGWAMVTAAFAIWARS
eukprot:TRINITY_DN3799_c0_g2_i4.p1 TRINITY_DN3799_c0_g2~~TRINITY_DN3799_c0_g2_i4.p1  ORF type:complete len:822 (+),score=126.50 TRINITY_DN3799_c0_g2_i4:63-2528(+)